MRRPSLRLLSALLVVAAALLPTSTRAQAATYDLITLPAPHWNPFPPWISPITTPRIGHTFELSAPGLLFGCSCHPSYFLMTGFSSPNVDVTQLGPQFHGVLLTTSSFVLGRNAVRSQQDPVIDIWIPDEPLLIGVEFFQQVAFFFDSPTHGSSVLLGTAGHAVIGR